MGDRPTFDGTRVALPVPDVQHVRLTTYDAQDPDTATIYVDGDETASGRAERTRAFVYSLDETTDVGSDTASPVSPDYPAGNNTSTGTIHWVRLVAGENSHDHLIDPAKLLQFAIS